MAVSVVVDTRISGHTHGMVVEFGCQCERAVLPIIILGADCAPGHEGETPTAFAAPIVQVEIAMAEKEKKEEKAAPAAPPASAKDKPAADKKGGGLLGSLPVMLGVVMIVEAAVIFAGIKFLGGGPKPAGAEPVAESSSGSHGESGGKEGGHGTAAGAGAAKADGKKLVEITVIEFKAPNRVSGTTYIYDVKVALTTKADNKDKVQGSITERSATIMDRTRTIIAQTDPAKLGGGQEPGLETLRRQIKHQLEEIIGEGLIDEVVIPKCIPYRADF